MSTLTLLHNIGDKNRAFDIRLTKDYWLTKLQTATVSFLEDILKKLTNKSLHHISELTLMLQEVYKESKNIDSEEAEEALPIIKKLRETITKQNSKFASIEYGHNEELRTAFVYLVKLVNRIESSVQKQLYNDSEVLETPAHIKEKMASNSKKAIENAILQEADH